MSQDAASNYEAMTLDELVAERERLIAEKNENNEVLARCRAQIEAAKSRVWSDNVYDDPKWFAAVNSRARFAGRRDQELAAHVSQLRRIIAQKKGHKYQTVDHEDPISILIQALRLLQEAIDQLKDRDEKE